MTAGSAGRSTGSRSATVRSAACAESTFPDTAARNASPGTSSTVRSVAAFTVAVRGTPRTSAISPNQSPAPSFCRMRRPCTTAADPPAIT